MSNLIFNLFVVHLKPIKLSILLTAHQPFTCFLLPDDHGPDESRMCGLHRDWADQDHGGGGRDQPRG